MPSLMTCMGMGLVMRAGVREGNIQTPMEEVQTHSQLHRLELTNL